MRKPQQKFLLSLKMFHCASLRLEPILHSLCNMIVLDIFTASQVCNGARDLDNTMISTSAKFQGIDRTFQKLLRLFVQLTKCSELIRRHFAIRYYWQISKSFGLNSSSNLNSISYYLACFLIAIFLQLFVT